MVKQRLAILIRSIHKKAQRNSYILCISRRNKLLLIQLHKILFEKQGGYHIDKRMNTAIFIKLYHLISTFQTQHGIILRVEAMQEIRLHPQFILCHTVLESRRERRTISDLCIA